MFQNIYKLLKSFQCAFQGVRDGFGQRNFQLHVVIGFIVICCGILWKISIVEWIIILIIIGLILSVELVNTCIEELSNLIRDRHHLDYRATRSIRDMAAGSVLVLAIVAAIVGYLIFWPRIISQPLW